LKTKNNKRTRMNRKKIAITGATIFSGLALAACGSSSTGTGSTNSSASSPKQAVAQSIQKLESASSIGINVQATGTVSSNATVDATFAKESFFFDIASASGGSVFSGSKLNIDAGLTGNGQTPIEFRDVSGTFYAKIDLSKLDLGASSASLQTVTSSLSQSSPQLAKLLSGNWVSISASQLKSLIPSSDATASTSTLSSSVYLKLVKNLISGFNSGPSSATVTSHGGGQYTISISLRKLSADVQSAARAAEKSSPEIAALTGKLDTSNQVLSTVTSKTISLNVTLSNGSLSKVVLPLGQFSPTSKGSTIILTFTQPGAISAPSGASALNVAQLKSSLSGLGG
jgi:hypothetical protein